MCAAEIVLYYCNKAAENPTVLRVCFKGNIFIQKSKERKTRRGCMNCAVQALM
jgi:ATP phosphoribosyltransferase regulatory subunit HisZ